MGQHVAVEQPVAGSVWCPSHLEYMPDVDMLGDRTGTLFRRVTLIVLAVTLPIDREIESMEVHGMVDARRIDHPPVRSLADFVREAFGVWPVLTVDRRDFSLEARASAFRPNADHKNTVIRLRAGCIDNEGPGKHCFRSFARVERFAGGGSPVQVGAGCAREELHLARLTG